MNNSPGLAQTITDAGSSIMSRLSFNKLRRMVLTVRPKSERELKKRIEDYLLKNPKSAMIFFKAGVTQERLVSKLSSYAK